MDSETDWTQPVGVRMFHKHIFEFNLKPKQSFWQRVGGFLHV